MYICEGITIFAPKLQLFMCKKLFLTLFLALCSQLASSQGVFTSQRLPDSILVRMRGKSLPDGARISVSDLRYLQLAYIDFDGRERVGEMVCHKSIAEDVLYIFRQLHEARYPIASVQLIDDFGADDESSMRANNTSCFCYRAVAGSSKLSKHAQGLAIDLNPLQNPCVRVGSDGELMLQPATAYPYMERSRDFPHKIDRLDLAYKLFTSRGFRWGGAWRSVKDYQHFEK